MFSYQQFALVSANGLWVTDATRTDAQTRGGAPTMPRRADFRLSENMRTDSVLCHCKVMVIFLRPDP